MAVYFLNMKTFGRGNGGSATSAIAYRAGERIRDERTGKVFDHTGRGGVLHTEIVLPERLADADMSWAKDRANLWNMVEAAETRSNARVAREILVGLPAELDAEQRLGLVRGFSQELADRHRFVVDFAVHAPRTDPRNFHAHLLTSTREIHSTGFGAKTALEISDQQRFERGVSSFFQELVATRERWAQRANEALSTARIAERIDHRSLAAQGVDREPALYLPRPIYEMERRGERNAVADRLREEHQARVAERVQRAAREMEPARQPSRPQSLEDVRRQARENWLRMRAEARGEAPLDRTAPHSAERNEGRDAARSERDSGRAGGVIARELGHSRDDDLGR
jgi:ATP-dependent exoDNAse (exonuclease V) alpha subunit